jgi:integrase
MGTRQLNRLSAAFVAKTKTPGAHNDGNGLYLECTPSAEGVSKSWVLRYKLNGSEHWMGLGSVSVYSLLEAREQARLCRQKIHQGIDPIRDRKDKRATVKAEQGKRMSFREAAQGYLSDNQESWRSEVHLNQWTSSLTRYVYPVIGDLQVTDVETAHVTRILRPIWTTKGPTATRVRGRIEQVLSWATANGNRTGANPAAWDGHLEHILPKQEEVEEHHAALPYRDLPTFYATLAEAKGVPARALEALVLTATRMGDILGAKWSEFDLNQKVWIIPPHTKNGDGRATKTGKEHRVPLGSHLVALLQGLPRNHLELVFPVGHNTVRDLKDRLLPEGMHATLHGFRSTFSDWAYEHDKSDKFTEAALQHSNGNKVKRAYQRSDALNQRRPLMEDWERFCLGA